MKPRIHIIGGPGSGKSYTALELSARFGVPVYDLDDLFWERSAPGYGVRADATIRDQQLGSIVAQDGWIIEGVYYGWLAPSFDTADMIIALTPSLLTRHRRVITRFALRKFGQIRSKKQESLADLWRLLRWSQTYDARHLVQARDAITARGRKWSECRTFEHVLAATSSLRVQRTTGSPCSPPAVDRARSAPRAP
jgi:adenylate kinase family enzyme